MIRSGDRIPTGTGGGMTREDVLKDYRNAQTAWQELSAIYRMADEILRLRTELVEARKDTARLNAVERHGCELYPKEDNRWEAFGIATEWVTGATAREAIDAAIDAARGEGFDDE